MCYAHDFWLRSAKLKQVWLCARLHKLRTTFMIFGGVSANEASFFAFDLHKNSQIPKIPFLEKRKLYTC